MIRPVINLNGETRKSHVEKRLTALEHLRTAIYDIMSLAPHPRDYPGHEERFNRDSAYHQARINTLSSIKTDIEMEALCIQEGEDSGKR